MNITAPPREPNTEGPRLVDITLEPMRSEEFTVPTTEGEATYRISYGQGISREKEQPNILCLRGTSGAPAGLRTVLTR